MRNMRVSFSIVLLIVSSLHIYAQQKQSQYDFEIVFGGYFHGDSVSLKLNGISILENRKLNSGTTGATGVSVIQDKNGLVVRSIMTKSKMKRISIKSQLLFEVSLNNRWYKYKFDRLNGNIFLVQYYNPDGSGKKIFTVEQSDEQPLFL
ncbi:MAG: hypothetical protein WDN26_06100 [Chitinophagaceae bacterium]